LAGIEPLNPAQPASSPLDNGLGGFYRDDPAQPWPRESASAAEWCRRHLIRRQKN